MYSGSSLFVKMNAIFMDCTDILTGNPIKHKMDNSILSVCIYGMHQNENV